VKSTLLAVLLLATTFATRAPAQDTGFKVCKSTYALCTTARCSSIPGNPDSVACKCDVRTGYSLGAKDCEDVPKPVAGTAVKSRYFPIASFVSCSNNKPWAFCLDSPCVIDAKGATATCTCSLKQGSDPYVIVTDRYAKDTCSSGVISSATVMDVLQATEFLKTSEHLPPRDFKVLNVERK
jgi:hypothetical protein